MDSSDQDYLTDYRLFFDSIYESFNLADDPLPVHIGKYNVAEFEIVGEIICWCLEYLNIRKCPPSLLAPLCRSVIGEMEDEIRRNPEGCGYRTKEDDYQTLKLMQVTIRKLSEVCLRYRDNSELSRLPPPPPVPPSVSAAAVKNGRRTMEDAHIIIHDLHSLFGIQGYGVASYYAVFDGHIGSDAALYSCSHVYQYLMESQYYPSNPEAAFKEAFIKTDERFIDKSNKENLKSGTTAVSVLIRHDLGKLYVAWLGDSQAILVNGRNFIQLVNPHRPEQMEERERIEKMGGSVVYWGTWRVNGQLAVSRAIGDVDYKPYVTADADVCSYDLSGDEDFLLLACDGLWDVLSEKDAVEEVYKCLEQNKGDRSRVSASLVQAAKSLGSKDNISVVVAWLDMSTLENGHFPEAPDVLDTAEEIPLPPVLRSIKPSAQALPAAPQRLDEDAEKWLMTLPWSYADVLKRKPAPKEDPPAVAPKEAVPPPEESPRPEPEERPDVCQEVSEQSRQEVPDVCQKAPEATPAPAKGEEAGADAGGESGEDSDEEWNYISGKENRANNQHNKQQELSEEDMESQLNPNAAEFVPFSTLSDDISHSPTKQSELRSLEKVKVPSAKKFLEEVAKRPSEIDEFGENDKTLNGDLNNISTKAIFGDDSESLNASSMDSSLLQNETFKSTNPFAPSQVPNFVQDHFAEDHLGGFKSLNESQVEGFDLLSGKGGEQASPLLRESPEPGLHNGQLGSPSPNRPASPCPVPDQGPETCVDSESEEDVINPQEKENNLEFEEKFTQRLVDEAFKAGPAVLEDSLSFYPKETQNDLLSEVISECSQNKLIDHVSQSSEFSIENIGAESFKQSYSNCFSDEVKNQEQDVVCLSLEATPMNAEQVILDQSPVEEVCCKREVLENVNSPVKEASLNDGFINVSNNQEIHLENGFELNAVEKHLAGFESQKEEPIFSLEKEEKENVISDFEKREENEKVIFTSENEGIEKSISLEEKEVKEPAEAEVLCNIKKDENNLFEFMGKQEVEVEEVIKSTDDALKEESELCTLKKIEDDFGSPQMKNDDAYSNMVCSTTNGTEDISPEEDSRPHSPADFSKIAQSLPPQIEDESTLKAEFGFDSSEDPFYKKPSALDSFSNENDYKAKEDSKPIEQEEIESYRNEDNIVQMDDEMSSSMIDYGEDKVLPQPQSNQLNLVQDLQFEVQEKNEGDTESDSGFEIINASEASTIEMEMRIQSEKEAGALDEKLLLDKNEAEVEETLLSRVEEEVITEVDEKVEVKENESLLTKMEEEIVETPLGERVSQEVEKNGGNELEEKGTSEVEEKVVNELQENVVCETEVKIVSELKEKVPEIEEKMMIAVEEKVESKLEEKLESQIEEKLEASRLEKVEYEVEEKVSNKVQEEASNELTRTASNGAEEKMLSEQEEKAANELKEKVVSELKEDVASEDKPETEIAVNGTATPPTEKEELITAAVVAGVATATVGGAATVAVSETKTEEKKKAVSQKKPDPVGKVGTSAKTAPAKPSATKPTTTSKAPAAAKAPIGKTTAAAKPASPITKTASPRPPSATTKPATPTSKPSTPTTKTAPAKPLSKPTTATTTKAPVPSAALKSKPAASTAVKPAAAKPDVAKPAAAKPTTTAAKPGVTTTAKPSAAAPKKPLTPTSSTAKPPAAAKPAPTKPATATKAPVTKSSATSTTKPPTPSSRPSSATTKPAVSSTTKAPAKPSAASAKPPSAKPPTAKSAATTPTSGVTKTPATKPPATKAPAKPTPAAPLNKKPAAPTTIKKPAAPTDKSVKEANNKLASAKTAAKKVDEKKIVSKKEEIIEHVEPLTQEPIISTTTNGHISLIENGIPTPEIAAEVI